MPSRPSPLLRCPAVVGRRQILVGRRRRRWRLLLSLSLLLLASTTSSSLRPTGTTTTTTAKGGGGARTTTTFDDDGAAAAWIVTVSFPASTTTTIPTNFVGFSMEYQSAVRYLRAAGVDGGTGTDASSCAGAVLTRLLRNLADAAAAAAAGGGASSSTTTSGGTFPSSSPPPSSSSSPPEHEPLAIRIGGNSADTTCYDGTIGNHNNNTLLPERCKGTLTLEHLKQLAEFAARANDDGDGRVSPSPPLFKYVFDANFAASEDPRVVATPFVAALFSSKDVMMREHVAAVEIGNEINLYARHAANDTSSRFYRPPGTKRAGYGYEDYEPEFAAYVESFRSEDGGMPRGKVQGGTFTVPAGATTFSPI